MRPGRPEDMELLLSRFRADAMAGQRQFVSPGWLSTLLRDFDWDARCRVVDGPAGQEGLVLVMDHPTAAGIVTRVEASSGSNDLKPLLEWGILFSHASGALAAQVWSPPEPSGGLAELGLSPVRPFWRMDRPDLEAIPEPGLAAGYRVITQATEPRPPEQWTEVFNRSFARHFNHAPQSPEEFWRRHGSNPDLLLMAVTEAGEPAALVLGNVEPLAAEDPRPSPLGTVAVVGTLPEHRRRGLALRLTAGCLRRFRERGAASASLHVDGLNADRAYDVYRRLGFEIGFEAQVWEKRFR